MSRSTSIKILINWSIIINSATKPLYKTPLYKNKKVFIVILLILLVMYLIVEVLDKEEEGKTPVKEEETK